MIHFYEKILLKKIVFNGCLTPFFASPTCVAVFQGCVGFPTIFLSHANKSRQVLNQ